MKLWIVDIAAPRHWINLAYMRFHGIGLFRNRRSVIPGRWGFSLFGLIEIGDRTPSARGRWLKDMGLWPW